MLRPTMKQGGSDEEKVRYFIDDDQKHYDSIKFYYCDFFGTVYLIGTKYVVDHRIAREFLDRVNHVPLNPEVVYFASILLFIVLIFLMYYRTIIARNHKVLNVLFTVVQLTICFGLMYLFNMGYNGIVLLVFVTAFIIGKILLLAGYWLH